MSINMQLVDQYIASQTKEICAFLYDLNALKNHIKQLVQPLPETVQFYYAIKANSDSEVLKTLLPHVYGFEVASMGEIGKVREISATVPIAFGGPGKTFSELEYAIAQNVQLFHLESELQMARLNMLAKRENKKINVLLRVNPRFSLPDATLQMAGAATQFGIDQHHIEPLLERLNEFENLTLRGFHFHCISNNLDAKKHVKAVAMYIDTMNDWQQRYDLALTTVNVGGGIGVSYQEGGPVFEWQSYCESLSRLLKQHNHLSIAMECGRYVSAFFGVYLAEVTDIKSNHDEFFAVLRGGNHHFRLPSSWQHNHPFKIIHRNEWPYNFARPVVVDKAVTLCGELCTPKDVLAKRVNVEKLRVGDVVLFEKASAYGWHISHHNFLSHPHPERQYFPLQP